jgi:hypothetical protein
VARRGEESEFEIVDGTSGRITGGETIASQAGVRSTESDLHEDPARRRTGFPERPDEGRTLQDDGANIDESTTGNDSDYTTVSFKPHLPDWLEQAMKHRTGNERVGTHAESSWTTNTSRSQVAIKDTQAFANAVQPGYTPFYDRKLESPSRTEWVSNEFDLGRQEGNAGAGKVLPSSSNSLYPARSSSVGIHGYSMALSLPASPTVNQPFATPGPHAKQRAIPQEGKEVHGRFLPRSATPNPAFAFKRLQTANRMGSVDIEPMPFSRPYVQTSEALAVKNKYSERRKRDLCLQSAINLPTIEEIAGESWYASSPPSSQDHGNPMQQSEENYYHSQNLAFEQGPQQDQAMSEGAEDNWQASVKYDDAYPLTDNMHDDTESRVEMPSSPRWIAQPAEGIPVYSEVSLDPSASSPVRGSQQTGWMTARQLLEERHIASDPYLNMYDRSSSAQGDAERYYAYSGEAAHEAGNSSEDQTEAALVMDIEVLEAAAAAASSEGSITAVNAFANGSGDHGLVKLAGGDQVTGGLTREVSPFCNKALCIDLQTNP